MNEDANLGAISFGLVKLTLGNAFEAASLEVEVLPSSGASRNRKFADALLEGTGFELLVPSKGHAAFHRVPERWEF